MEANNAVQSQQVQQPVPVPELGEAWTVSECPRCHAPVTVYKEPPYPEYKVVEDRLGSVCVHCITDEEARDMNRVIQGALDLFHGRMFAEQRAKQEAALAAFPPPVVTKVVKFKQQEKAASNNK